MEYIAKSTPLIGSNTAISAILRVIFLQLNYSLGIFLVCESKVKR